MFYVTSVDQSKTALLIQGNLRSNDTAQVYESVMESLAATPELKDSIQLFYQRFPLEIQQQAAPDDAFFSMDEVESPLPPSPPHLPGSRTSCG